MSDIPLCVILPWPPKELSPNARLHWAQRARIVKRYRRVAGTLARAAGMRPARAPQSERIPMRIVFHPPDKRRRDRDNMQAAMKAGLDGIADALGVDDVRFAPAYEVGEPRPGGRVVVEVME